MIVSSTPAGNAPVAGAVMAGYRMIVSCVPRTALPRRVYPRSLTVLTPAPSCTRAVTSSESPTFSFAPRAGVRSVIVGEAIDSTIESVRVLSAASVTVVRTTILSPFLAPVSGTVTLRVVVSATGLSVTVSSPRMIAPSRTVVMTVDTPLLSVAFTVTTTGTPSVTALLTAPATVKDTWGRSTSSLLLVTCVGSRVSQLDATTTPSTSAAYRAENLKCVICAPQCG